MIDDLIAVAGASPFETLHREKYLAHGRYSKYLINQVFGNYREFRRAAGLEPTRQHNSYQTQTAKHAASDIYRDFAQREILPACNLHERESQRTVKRILLGSDFHDVSCDPFVLDVFLDTAERLQPDVIILGGDVFDCYEWSRYTVDPRMVNVKERFDFVHNRIFAPLRKAAPNAQIDFILGNHEWRLLKYLAEKAPQILPLLSDVMGLTLADIFGVRKFGINLICKWDLAAWNKRDEKAQVNHNHASYFGNAYTFRHIPPTAGKSYTMSGSSGHTHKPKLEAFPNILGRATWLTLPSMAKTDDFDYVEGEDSYYSGFGIAYVDTVTKAVQQYAIVVDSFAIVEGKFYGRP